MLPWTPCRQVGGEQGQVQSRLSDKDELCHYAEGEDWGRKLLAGNHRKRSLSQGPVTGAFQRSWWVTGQSTKHREGQFVAGSWSTHEAHAIPGVAGARQGGAERLTLPSPWN